jgi:polyisoprenoid-binding protein YceI
MAKWAIEPAHSTIGFVARHMMVTKVRGVFKKVDLVADFDPANPAQGSVSVEIDVNSIDTGVADRDNHLRSPDFFDVANYPVMTFRSTSGSVRSGSSGTITGDLTIRGITRPVTLDVDFLGEITDPFGNQKVAFTASTKINREDWGLTWNVAIEAGGWLVSKDISIEIEAQLVRVQETVTA